MSNWLEWQIVDSAFPTGAFAHSFGLEAAWQQGEVEDVAALRRFLDASICQAGRSVLPFVTAAHLHPARLESLDDLAEAFLLNPVSNRASRVQGRALAATVGRVWPSPATRELRARAEATHAHLAPWSGALFAAIGLSLAASQRATLYGITRGLLGAAVRLGLVGSYEVQRLQAASSERLDDTLDRCSSLTIDDLAQTAPVLDVLHAGHDRLYSRLFQS
jgi:urease accessory protein